MEKNRPVLCTIGVVFEGLAFVLADVHFYAGPFPPQPAFEQVVAKKDAAQAALKGEEPSPSAKHSNFDAERITQIAVAVPGAIAIVFGAVGLLKGESLRGVTGAAVLGVLAIGFQFIPVALGAILFVILVAPPDRVLALSRWRKYTLTNFSKAS